MTIIAKGIKEYLMAKGMPDVSINRGDEAWGVLQWAKKHDITLYVKFLKGKYAGSIGTVSVWSIDIGETRAKCLIPKNMEFLPDYQGPCKTVMTKAPPQIDKYGSTIKINDRVLFLKLQFGIVQQFNRVNNRFSIIDVAGNVYTGISRADIVNLDNLDLEKMSTNVTIAKLSKD